MLAFHNDTDFLKGAVFCRMGHDACDFAQNEFCLARHFNKCSQHDDDDKDCPHNSSPSTEPHTPQLSVETRVYVF